MEEKNNQGITLIALVITIIVLLILAGISIATLTGENGVLTKANTVKEKTERAGIIEQAQIDVSAIQTDNDGKITEAQFNEILKKYDKDGKCDKTNDEGEIIIETENNYVIKETEIYKIGRKKFFYMGDTRCEFEEGTIWSDEDFLMRVTCLIWDEDPFGRENTTGRLLAPLGSYEGRISYTDRDDSVYYLQLDGEEVKGTEKVVANGHYYFDF